MKPEEIREVANYVRTLSKLPPEAGVDVDAGKQIFTDNCAVCHGDDGKGNTALGSANLTDGLQLYGGDMKDLTYTITYARNSTMPAWGARLDPVTIKTLAVFVHSLGAGSERSGGRGEIATRFSTRAPSTPRRRRSIRRAVRGTFRRLKWALLLFCLGDLLLPSFRALGSRA